MTAAEEAIRMFDCGYCARPGLCAHRQRCFRVERDANLDTMIRVNAARQFLADQGLIERVRHGFSR